MFHRKSAVYTFSAEDPSERQIFFIEFSLAKSHNPSPLSPHIYATFSMFTYTFTLKMKAPCSSKTMVMIYQTTWHHIPETVIFIATNVTTTNLTYLFPL
jgi:hypothetical protein